MIVPVPRSFTDFIVSYRLPAGETERGDREEVELTSKIEIGLQHDVKQRDAQLEWINTAHRMYTLG